MPPRPIGAFSFPSPEGCAAPSQVTSRIVALARVASLLCGALVVSLFGTVWLAYFAAKRAYVIPYVADGGVFGCEVRTLKGPLANPALPAPVSPTP